MMNDVGFVLIFATFLLVIAIAIGVVARDDSELVCRHAIQRNFHMSREDVEKLLHEQREWESK